MLVYDPQLERALRASLPSFRRAATELGFGWRMFDCSPEFSQWLANNRFREALFQHPRELNTAISEFKARLISKLRDELSRGDEKVFFVLLGVGTLFGLFRTADLINSIADAAHGPLLVFFPGEHEANNYKIFDARDGWDYLAVPITAGAE